MMKGLSRNIDDLGRIVIPKEIRASYHIGDGDPLRVTCVPAGILLEPLDASCGICGSTEGLVVVEGVAICAAHARAIHEAWEAQRNGRN